MPYDLSLFYLALGVALLLFGMKLFWLFVGVAGFVAGFDFAQYTFVGQPESVILICALLCAMIGVVLAIFFQEVMIILAGALAGGVLALHWLSFFVTYDATSVTNWVVFIVGALVGGVVMFWGFNIALIIVSSFLGALLVVSVLPVASFIKLIAGVVLIVLGIYIQSMFLDSASDSKKR